MLPNPVCDIINGLSCYLYRLIVNCLLFLIFRAICCRMLLYIYIISLTGWMLPWSLAYCSVFPVLVFARQFSSLACSTDHKQARRSDEELTMILVRMVLGEPFPHSQRNPSAFNKPPCMNCSKQQPQCSCADPRLFHSVIDDVRIFREFVVYEDYACYPEYFVTYRRV